MRLRKKTVSFIGLGSAGLAEELYSYLKVHPEVYTLKEGTNFFSNPDIFAKGINWYESGFINDTEIKKGGELSSDYISSIFASGAIAKNYPDARLFAVIDSPLLAIKTYFLAAKLKGEIFSDTSLEHFLKRNPEILERCYFGKFLAHYFSYYSHNDLFIVTADEVNNEPLKMISSLYEFLGLDNKFIPVELQFLVPEEEEDPKKRGGIIKRSFKFLPKLIKKVYKFSVSKLKTKKQRSNILLNEAKSLEMSPKLEKFLKDHYRKDVAILSELLHRNFTEEWDF